MLLYVDDEEEDKSEDEDMDGIGTVSEDNMENKQIKHELVCKWQMADE